MKCKLEPLMAKCLEDKPEDREKHERLTSALLKHIRSVFELLKLMENKNKFNLSKHNHV